MTAEKQKPAHFFKKGVSGNPSGRPARIAELRALSQANFPLAIQRLGELIKSPDEETAFKAVAFTFLYILGRPPEGRDLMHVEMMRAKLTELMPVEDAPVEFLPPNSLLEQVSQPVPIPPAELTPPEATDAVTPVSAPSGLRCIYRGKDERCASVALDGSSWCATHKAKLFESVAQ